MRITIKIKHLLVIVTLVGLLGYLFIAIILPRIQLYAAKQQFELGADQGKQAILAALNDPISDNSKWEMIKQYMIENGADDGVMRFEVYIGPGTLFSIGSEQRMEFTWSEKLKFMNDYVMNAPVDGYMMRAAKQLAYYYNGQGQLDKAIELLDQAAARFNGGQYHWQRNELIMEQARLLLSHGEHVLPEGILERLSLEISNRDLNMKSDISLLRAKIMIRQGEFDQARVTLEQALQDYQIQWQEEKEQYGFDWDSTTGTIMQIEQLLEQLQNAEFREDRHTSQVSGVVRRSDGTPVANAGVFLRLKGVVNHSIDSSEPYQMMTDELGRFQFDTVLPDSYQLYLGLNYDQISGWTWPVMNDEWLDVGENEHVEQDIVMYPLMELKSPVNEAIIEESSFEFEWSEVEGAAYYNVNVGLQVNNGSVGSLLDDHIHDHRYSLTAKQLYDRHTGISSTKGENGEWIADPITLLGFANTNNRFYWNVEAYDENDKMITRSNGYRLSDDSIGNLPFFYLQERTMTAADLLLLDSQHEQALAAYKNNYESNPEDIHSLRMIIRLLESNESNLPDDAKSANEDVILPYLLNMVKINPTENYVFNLANYYYKAEDWLSFVDTYRINGIDITNSSYIQSTYATALMKLGRLEEARQLFQQAMEKDLSHRFVGNYLALVLYEDKDLHAAFELAQLYPERMPGGSGKDWYKLIVQLEEEAGQTAEPNLYMEQLKQKLGWLMQGNNEQLEQWLSTSRQTAAVAFIQAVLEVS